MYVVESLSRSLEIEGQVRQCQRDRLCGCCFEFGFNGEACTTIMIFGLEVSRDVERGYMIILTVAAGPIIEGRQLVYIHDETAMTHNDV
jgi:hypothetical protein